MSIVTTMHVHSYNACPHLPQPRAYPCCPEPRTLDPLTAPATSPRRQRLTPSPIPPDNCWSTRRCKWSGGIPASNCSAAFSCTRHRAVGRRAVKLRPPPRPAPPPRHPGPNSGYANARPPTYCRR